MGTTAKTRRDSQSPGSEGQTLADGSKTLADSGSAADGAAPRSPVQVPDHQLLSCIGRGSYGEVWLARNVMETYRAVKIVYRAAFEHSRPFEREFNGIQKFEPISRSHDGFVDVLQIGRTDDYFYYVMELADDVVTGQQIDPATYEPKTLRSQVQGHKALPFEQCVELGLSLTAALSHLHSHGLIHRDIKPSNIIFVNGIPKLADIGLVAEQSEAKSFVGTEGFIPPEGPGTAQADIYSLGKVLYEIATGKDRHEFPALPTLLGDSATDSHHLLELNSVFLKACQSDIKQRYQATPQMQEDLLLLRSGRSVKRAQAIERRLALLSRASLVGIILTVLTVLALYYTRKQSLREATLRARAEAGEYGADMALAYQALEVGHLGLARELVSKHEAYVETLWKRGSGAAGNWEWRYLWSQVRGDDLFILGRHDPIAQEAVFCLDGQHALSSGKDGRVKYWDVEQRKGRTVLTFNNRAEIGLSPDGKLLATGISSGEVGLWSVPDFRRLWQITNDDSSAGRLRFSPDGQLLAVGGGEVISLYSTATAQLLRRVTTQRDHGYSFKVGLAFSPDSKSLAFSRHNGDILLLDIASGEIQMLGNSGEYALALVFSPDGAKLISGESALRIWDLNSRSLIKKVERHRAQINALSFSPDGQLLATASTDQTIKLWSASDWEVKATLRGHEFELWSVAFSPDGKRLISAGKDDTVRVWPVKFESHEPQISNTDVDVVLGSSGDEPFVIQLRRGESQLRAFDLRSGQELAPLLPPTGLDLRNNVSTLSSDFRLASANVSGEVQFWDLPRRQSLWTVKYRGVPVTALDLSVLRQEIAVLYTDGTVQLMATRDGHVSKTFQSKLAARTGLEVFATHLAFSADGSRLLAAVDRVNEVPVWDLTSGVLHGVRVAHREGITSATLSRDGRLLCTASYDAYAVISDVDSGREVMRCSGQFTGFGEGAFSPDNTRVVLVGDDGYLSIWAVPGQRLARFPAPVDKHSDVIWDIAGDLFTGSQRGIYSWRAPKMEEIQKLESRGRPP
jgi:WD40 repeat protein